MLFFFYQLTLNDAPKDFQYGLQDPASPIAEGMMSFHNHLVAFIIGIAFFVFFILSRCIILFNEQTNPKAIKLLHNSTLEIIWTLIPAIILIFIAIPSFALLYSTEELIEPNQTIKVIGHQWYWSYEMLIGRAFKQYIFDSYLIPEEDLPLGFFRNLEVDNRLVLPTGFNLRILVTAMDVLHSWAIPSLGVKADATPGKLLQIPVVIKRSSIFYGQCSEICGVNHAFMPIVIVSIHPLEHWFYILPKIGLSKLIASWVLLAPEVVDEFGILI